jgi:ribosomal protein L12E/L44/L45/RPP1/RPP2
MEKQRENSARVDSILIQLMKKHAPEIAEKIEMSNNAAAGAPASEDPAGAMKRETDAGADAAKRQKVA